MILNKELKDHEKLQPIRKLSEFIPLPAISRKILMLHILSNNIIYCPTHILTQALKIFPVDDEQSVLNPRGEVNANTPNKQ